MEKLKRILSQEDTVLFIGSGISLWSGLPTWSGLIERLASTLEENGIDADLVRKEASNDLLQAASYGFDKLTNAQIGEFIRNACLNGKAIPHAIHEKIVNLGPRCFITTNYDDLIEKSLRMWRPEENFRGPITNKQLTEMAEIVHARATNYIFKPHGDAGDSDSIVFTREQYRSLLPQGGRYSALETLKMILITRPVVYLGFGLRDPDFLFLRDLIANTYNGSSRDHYAILPDITTAEVDWWRKNYSVHLVTYQTVQESGRSKDHTPLLSLLDVLSAKEVRIEVEPEFNPSAPSVVLSLVRYASGLARLPSIENEFEIRVELERNYKSREIYSRDTFDRSIVGAFLTEGPDRAILLGLPGAGKSYSINRAVAEIANVLSTKCLMHDFNPESTVVPIIIDMKLYSGNIWEMISETLPIDLPLEALVEHFSLKIFVDSFNEMPREFWESNIYESDLELLEKKIKSSGLIIGSRTSDGLKGLSFPIYHLNYISKETIKKELSRMNILFKGRFVQELYSLLKRPFYFQYILSKRVNLPENTHPKDFYKAFLKDVNTAFQSKYKVNFNLANALSVIAYDSLNVGEEAITLERFITTLEKAIQNFGLIHVSGLDMVNWMVSYSVLIPHLGAKVAFVHQSITEYLAATELSRIYSDSPELLREKVQFTRWDQAIFLALSILPENKSRIFLSDLISYDFLLALNAVKYLEFNRDEVVTRLLNEIPKQHARGVYGAWSIDSVLERNLPVSRRHIPHLQEIVKMGDSLGGAAASRIIELEGAATKEEMLRNIFERPDDPNFTITIADSLQIFAENSDVESISKMYHALLKEIDDYELIDGFTHGMSQFLAKLDISSIIVNFPITGTDERTILRNARFLCDMVMHRNNDESFLLILNLIELLPDTGALALYLMGSDDTDNEKFSWDLVNEDIVKTLLRAAPSGTNCYEALHVICKNNSKLAVYVAELAEQRNGLEKLIMQFCANRLQPISLKKILEQIVELSSEELSKLPLQVFKIFSVDWEGDSVLLKSLVDKDNSKLLDALLGPGIPIRLKNINTVNFNPIIRYLEFMEQLSLVKETWVAQKLGCLLAVHGDTATHNALIEEYNKPESIHKSNLEQVILPFIDGLTVDSFNDNTIGMLLDKLNQKMPFSFRGNLLSITATENFIYNRLIPMANTDAEPLKSNIEKILKEAGARHGRRYLI